MIKTEIISDRQSARSSLDWILDMKKKDIDAIMRQSTVRGEDSSMKMVYEDCGIETVILLWRKLSSVTIYVSERPLNELRRIYVRQKFNPEDSANSAKALAVLLGVSEKFVYEALSETSKDDPRQMRLYGEDR